MSSPVEVGPLVARLVEVLDRLAATPDRQKAYLQQLGVGDSTDELALEFDDAFRPLDPLLRDAGAPDGVRDALRTLDSALARDPLDWTTLSLESSGWVEVRRLAAQALQALEAWKATERRR